MENFLEVITAAGRVIMTKKDFIRKAKNHFLVEVDKFRLVDKEYIPSMEIYFEGVTAADISQSIDACPYDKETSEYRIWLEGYDYANRTIKI